MRHVCAVGVARARARHISSQYLFANTFLMAHARSVCCVRTVLCRSSGDAMCDVVLYFIKYVCRVFLDIQEVPGASDSLSLGSKELVRA